MKDIKRLLHINFKDGSNRKINPVQGKESFNDLSFEEKQNISSLVLQVGNQKFTISRVCKTCDVKTYYDGFFYHVMEGYRPVGSGAPDIPFAAERIGFCYNGYGDAVAIHVNYITGNITNYDENVHMLRMNTEMFYDVPRGHKTKYRAVYKPFREELADLKTANRQYNVVNSEGDIAPVGDGDEEVPTLVLPQLPGITLQGSIPRVLFNSKDVSSYNVPKK